MPTVPPPPESSPDGDLRPPAETSPLLRFGALVGAGALAAGLAATPPALRVAGALDGSPGRGEAWLAVTAALVVPMIIAVAVLRGARDGVRAFGGAGSDARLVAAFLWLALFMAWLALFGAALRATTHHHALAGATFSIVSVAVGAVLAIVAARVTQILFACPQPARAVLLSVLAGSLALAVLLASARLGRGATATSASALSTAELLIDGLAFFMAALLASRPELGRRRAVALIGPPIAAAIVMAGISELRAMPQLAPALEARAPAYAVVFHVLSEH